MHRVSPSALHCCNKIFEPGRFIKNMNLLSPSSSRWVACECSFRFLPVTLILQPPEEGKAVSSWERKWHRRRDLPPSSSAQSHSWVPCQYLHTGLGVSTPGYGHIQTRTETKATCRREMLCRKREMLRKEQLVGSNRHSPKLKNKHRLQMETSKDGCR